MLLVIEQDEEEVEGGKLVEWLLLGPGACSGSHGPPAAVAEQSTETFR